MIALSDKLDPFNSDGRKKFDVVIEAPTPHQAVSFVRELSSRITKDPEHFESIFYRVDPEPFKSWQLLYLDTKDLVALKEKLEFPCEPHAGICRAARASEFSASS